MLKKKVLAILLVLLVSASAVIVFSPTFFFKPSIKKVEIISIREHAKGLKLEVSLVVESNFPQPITVEKGIFDIFYSGNKTATISIENPFELKQGENSVLLDAFVSQEELENFGKALGELFLKGKLEVKYKGSATVRYFFLSIPINLEDFAYITQISLKDLIESISFSYDNIYVSLRNIIKANYTIQNISGEIKIHGIRILTFISKESYTLSYNKTALIKLDYNSSNISLLKDAISSDLDLEVKLRLDALFGGVKLLIPINLSGRERVAAQSTFTLYSVSYFKYPERLEILGYISSEIFSIRIRAINIESGGGDILLNNTKVASFKLAGSLQTKGLILNKVIIFPISEEFFRVLNEFMKNSSIKVNIVFTSRPVINLKGDTTQLDISQYSISLDLADSRFIIKLNPRSISYDQVRDSLKIGFNFNFLTSNITGLPIIIEKAQLRLNFEKGRLIFNQTILGPIDLSVSENYFVEVVLNLRDPSIKALIQDFASKGSMILEVEDCFLKVKVYEKSFDYFSNLNIVIVISPLDIIDAKAYLNSIKEESGSYRLNLEISIRPKLEVENLLLRNARMTVLTLEGNKILENFYQEINEVLTADKGYNFTSESLVKISNTLISKIIKDFFEKGRTDLIILNANISVSIGAFNINLLLQNITLSVILLPLLQVHLKEISPLKGDEAEISFTLYLRGVSVPFRIESLSGNLTDDQSNLIGSIRLENLNFIEGYFDGKGHLKLLNRNQSGIAKIFLGYNVTVIGRNITASVSIYGETYNIVVEKSLIVQLIPEFERTIFNVNIVDFKVEETFKVNVRFLLQILRSILDVEPIKVYFDFYDEVGFKLGKGVAENFNRLGKGVYEATAVLELENTTRLDYVIGLFANGENVLFNIYEADLVLGFLGQTYFLKIPLNLQISYKTTPIEISILEFHITKISGNEINAVLSVAVKNPYNFPINITLAVFSVYDEYDSKFIGKGELRDLTIMPNSTFVINEIRIVIPDASTSYILRHYDEQTGIIEMQVYITILVSLSSYGLSAVIQLNKHGITVKYP